MTVLMAVPVMVQEKEKVGAIIEALSYESYKTVRPAKSVIPLILPEV